MSRLPPPRRHCPVRPPRRHPVGLRRHHRPAPLELPPLPCSARSGAFLPGGSSGGESAHAFVGESGGGRLPCPAPPRSQAGGVRARLPPRPRLLAAARPLLELHTVLDEVILGGQVIETSSERANNEICGGDCKTGETIKHNQPRTQVDFRAFQSLRFHLLPGLNIHGVIRNTEDKIGPRAYLQFS
ncbi:hypothetical protein PVAP13_3NG024590 [Panicum virgatum]|uniref:Uncharacterized protein n=1 Tax=Panicum virgatum TaxID=38727 RepID=A0A8T0U1H2_PANVG|nr:hypothetical protein PVAP13_3NG024590 [Panicum virgatum]